MCICMCIYVYKMIMSFINRSENKRTKSLSLLVLISVKESVVCSGKKTKVRVRRSELGLLLSSLGVRTQFNSLCLSPSSAQRKQGWLLKDLWREQNKKMILKRIVETFNSFHRITWKSNM